LKKDCLLISMETQNQQPLTLEILIPGHKCGLIIGKGGDMIRKLQENSGTQMQIIQNSHAQSDQSKPLQIVGMPANVEMAKRMVEQLLKSDDNRMPKGAATGANRIEVNQVRGIARVIVPRSAVGFIIGRGGESIKRISQESGAHVQFEKEDGSNSSECCAILQGYKSQIDRAASIICELVTRSNLDIQKPSSTMIVPIAKTCLVIGKGGEVINKINRETGAHVDMSRDSPVDGVNKLFVIRGDPHQIGSAKQAILAQISDKDGDGPILTQNGHQQGAQNQWGLISDYGQQASHPIFTQPAAYDQLPVESSQPLPTQPQQHEGQTQQPTNPILTQPDYSTQWIEYYRLMGMHDKATEIEQLRGSRNGQ